MGLPHAISPADLKGVDAAIIGAPYVASWTEYAGVPKSDWIAGPKRVRQQSIRYQSGYIQDFDLDVFEHLKVVDFGDAKIPPEANDKPTVENILRAQAAVEEKVNQALDAGALPIVVGQNSPCGSYAIAKPIAERTKGNVGV
ncbi:MAG TPA: arginase family protein, partial [Methylomirabilota bacterium]